MGFSIESLNSANSVKVSSIEPEYITVSLTGDVEASLRVCTYTDELGLLNYFKKLASYNKPWKNEVSWESFEKQFCISASCSSLGHVLFSIVLTNLSGSREDWEIRIGISSEFGLLEGFASDAERFFNQTRN